MLMSVKTKFGAASKGEVVQDPLVIPEDYRVPAGFFLGECRAGRLHRAWASQKAALLLQSQTRTHMQSCGSSPCTGVPRLS